jgi:hypothetical protein
VKRFFGYATLEWFFQEVLGFHYVTKILVFIAFLLYVVTVHNNDEQYRIEKRKRNIDLTWFGNLPTSTER